MWLVFEVTVSSTGLVILTHLLVPLLVFSDVSKIKEKALAILLKFREKYLNGALPRDVEEGGGVAAISGAVGCEEKERTKPDHPPPFNAAKYLFVSWRLASLCRELPESKLVLEFRTPWPKKRFGEKDADVASEYKEAVILTALSRILLYFLGAFLSCDMLLQDMIVQTSCNSALGLLAMGLIGLSSLHPVLPVAVVVVLLLFVGYLVRVASSWHNDLRTRLTKVTETKRQEEPSSPSLLPSQHISSLRQLTDLQESPPQPLPIALQQLPLVERQQDTSLAQEVSSEEEKSDESLNFEEEMERIFQQFSWVDKSGGDSSDSGDQWSRLFNSGSEFEIDQESSEAGSSQSGKDFTPFPLATRGGAVAAPGRGDSGSDEKNDE
jgi:hypothetical protein